MAYRTVFAHNKGGTGKTTSCVATAGALAADGAAVLVVDADPQANATAHLGLEPASLEHGLADLLLADVQGNSIGPRQCSYPTGSGIDVLPGSQQLYTAYHLLWEEDGRHAHLDDALHRVEDRYDHVLIDTPPALMHVAAAGIRAADAFHLVMDSSVFSAHGTGSLRRFLEKLPDRHRLIMNPDRVLFVSRRRNGLLEGAVQRLLGRDAPDRMRRMARALYGARFHHVPYSDAVIRSQKKGVPLTQLAPSSAAGRAYTDLAADLRHAADRRG